MTKTDPKPKNPELRSSEEEIDLGHLFYVIGKAISSVFAWLGNLLVAMDR